MARFPQAVWKGPVPNMNPGGMWRPILGLILHIEQGYESGTDAEFHNADSEASSHFGNPKTGPLDQWVDTNDKAWAQAAGNPRWISVEHEGESGDELTPSQLENDAQLLAWLHSLEDVQIQITDSVNVGGLGWHGMGGAAWGGHPDCPGEPIKAQRAAIITRARQILGAAAPAQSLQEGTEDMQAVVDTKGTSINGLTPLWEADEHGNTFAWNGARQLRTLDSYTTVHPRIVKVVPHPSGDGIILVGDDRRQDGGNWVVSTYAILA